MRSTLTSCLLAASLIAVSNCWLYHEDHLNHLPVLPRSVEAAPTQGPVETGVNSLASELLKAATPAGDDESKITDKTYSDDGEYSDLTARHEPLEVVYGAGHNGPHHKLSARREPLKIVPQDHHSANEEQPTDHVHSPEPHRVAHELNTPFRLFARREPLEVVHAQHEEPALSHESDVYARREPLEIVSEGKGTAPSHKSHVYARKEPLKIVHTDGKVHFDTNPLHARGNGLEVGKGLSDSSDGDSYPSHHNSHHGTNHLHARGNGLEVGKGLSDSSDGESYPSHHHAKGDHRPLNARSIPGAIPRPYESAEAAAASASSPAQATQVIQDFEDLAHPSHQEDLASDAVTKRGVDDTNEASEGLIGKVRRFFDAYRRQGVHHHGRHRKHHGRRSQESQPPAASPLPVATTATDAGTGYAATPTSGIYAPGPTPNVTPSTGEANGEAKIARAIPAAIHLGHAPVKTFSAEPKATSARTYPLLKGFFNRMAGAA